MNKVAFSIISFFFVFGSVFAQEKVNQVNAKGERIGVWEKYYENKKIRYQGQFENGKEVGVFKYYSPVSSKFPMALKTFKANSDEALVQHFTLKGILESEGKMKGKHRIGKWIYFQKDGKSTLIEENYENNVLNGDYKVFYEDGKLTKHSLYKDGKLHGNSKKYSPESILIEDVNYVNGQLHGLAAFYEDNGNLKQKGMYEEDLKVGPWEFFEDGELSETKEIKVWKDKE
jgi:antitoxin component YwqK of YwqJK toxin-antitoxin module